MKTKGIRIITYLLAVCLLCLAAGCAGTNDNPKNSQAGKAPVTKPNPMEHVEDLYMKPKSEALSILGLTEKDLAYSRQERVNNTVYQREEYVTDDLSLRIMFVEEDGIVFGYVLSVPFATNEERTSAMEDLRTRIEEKCQRDSELDVYHAPDGAMVWVKYADEMPFPSPAGVQDASSVPEKAIVMVYQISKIPE